MSDNAAGRVLYLARRLASRTTCYRRRGFIRAVPRRFGTGSSDGRRVMTVASGGCALPPITGVHPASVVPHSRPSRLVPMLARRLLHEGFEHGPHDGARRRSGPVVASDRALVREADERDRLGPRQLGEKAQARPRQVRVRGWGPAA